MSCFRLFGGASFFLCHIFSELCQRRQQVALEMLIVTAEHRRSQSTGMKLSLRRVLEKKQPALWSNSSPAPSSVNLYVRRKPLEHDRGEMKVSAAVPTTRCNSPPRAENGTTAKEKAASFPSNGISATVLAYQKQHAKLSNCYGKKMSANLYRINNPDTRRPRPSWSLWTTKYFWWQIDNFIVDVFALSTLENIIIKTFGMSRGLTSSSRRLLTASCPITR
jgi:hypothetical protein